MTYLPDVNVWIALAVAQHVHHRSAQKWLSETSGDTLAFCRVTQMGLLRLLTNHRVMSSDVFSPEGAWRLLEQIRQNDQVIFVAEPFGLERSWREMTRVHKTGANFWTDVYLSAFAQLAEYTLVTFDRGFSNHKLLSFQILG